MAIDTPAAVGSVSIQGNAFPIYGSLDRAREYFSARLGAEVYTGASFGDQQKANVTARRLIDRQDFKVAKAVSTQFTAFPQGDETTVPVDVEVAQYEIALLLLEDPEFFGTNTTGSNEKLLRAGPVAIEFFSSTLPSSSGSTASKFPTQIHELLSPFLASGASLITIPHAGGTKNKSFVIPRVGYDISEGL